MNMYFLNYFHYFKMAERSFVNEDQKKMLVEFLTQHEELRSGRFTATFSRQTAHNLWQQISHNLNMVQGGARKDWQKWRKVV